MGILLEHLNGNLPTWLAPVQAVVLTITERADEYAGKVLEILKNQGFRVECDLRNEKVGFKIREHTLKRVPFMLVAGDKEVSANHLSVRTRNGKDLGSVSLDVVVEKLRQDIESRGRESWEG